MKLFNILFFVFLFSACNNVKEPQVHKISAEQMLEVINDESIQLIDVRTQEEFNLGRLKNAQNICITNDDFIAKAERLDKEKPIYLYCKVGGRSAKAAEILKEMGFKYIYDMSGGFDEWSQKGFETDKS